jgi:hypothetical protein
VKPEPIFFEIPPRHSKTMALSRMSLVRWDEVEQEPFDWQWFEKAMRAQLAKPPRRPYLIPIRLSLYRALERRRARRSWFDALRKLGAL